MVPRLVSDDAVTPAASVVPVKLAAGTAFAVMLVLHPKPVPVVHVTALDAVEQDVIARAAGTPAAVVPMTTFADCAAKPLTGKPVAFVNVAADGVPRFGVVNTGDVAKTTLPEPVYAVLQAMPDDPVAVQKSLVVNPLPVTPPADKSSHEVPLHIDRALFVVS